MYKLKKVIGGLLLAFAGITQQANSQTISDHFFGVNAWMSDTIGDVNNCADPPCIKYGKLHKNWENIENSSAQIIRYGGIAPDKNKPTNYQYLRVVDSIRTHGMEPVMQVPFWDNRYTAQEAAAIVKYLNITMGRSVKYWIIANEPNLSYSYTSSAQIASYFKQFASAMKAMDPTIKIIGPETASFKQSIVTGLTTPGGADDITGKDAAGRYYLDYYSFHTYPFQSGQHTRSQIPGKLTASGSFQDNLVYLNSRLTAANNYHNRSGSNAIKSAVTETNICYTNASSDNLYGVGVNSFIGGQFVAEIYGIGLKQGVDFIHLWSAIEGNNVTNNGGYLDPFTGNKKPIYYHFKLMADNFRGQYVNCTTNNINVKSFGSKNSDGITTVLVMNMDSAQNFNFNMRLNATSITASAPLKINVDAGIGFDFTGSIQNQSTVLYKFDDSGILLEKCEYTIDLAAMNRPPSCTEYNTLTTGIKSTSAGNLDVKIFPNPSNGKFLLQLNNENRDEIEYEVEVINLVGQTVHSQKSKFLNGKQEIDLLNNDVAQGIYIVNINENGDSRLTKKIIISR
jgi:hypothetical protein